MKICGVMVAYGRPDMFEKGLESMLVQSLPLDRIFVIDNSPTDAARATVQKHYPLTEYRHFPENIGSEGGYAEGIRMASVDHDLIWLMDDDCVAEPRALEEMVGFIKDMGEREKIGAVRSARAWDKQQDGPPVKEIDDLFAWRGTLISSAAIKEIGLPKKELFLYGGDIEYGLRMRYAGYKIYLVYSSRIESLELSQKVKGGAGTLGMESYVQPYRIYYSYRNELRVYLDHRRYGRVMKLLLAGTKGFFVHLAQGEPGRAFAICDGVGDALRKRLGKSLKYVP